MKKLRILSLLIVITMIFAVVPVLSEGENAVFTAVNYGNSVGEVSGDANKFTITTNGADMWNTADDATAYLSGPYDFLYEEASNATVQVDFGGIKGYDGNPAGAGVMIRAANTDDAPNVLVRAVQGNSGETTTSVQVTWREKNGEKTFYKQHSVSGSVKKLRLTRKGNVFIPEAYNGSDWKAFNTVTVDLGKTIYAGAVAYSRNTNNFTVSSFQNLKIDISNDYDAAGFEGYVDNEALSSDVILRENFEDGSMIEGDESARNPIWENASKYFATAQDGEGNNHWLVRDSIVGGIYTGSRYMTDYEVSMDIKVFESDSDAPDNSCFVIGRRRNTLYYANQYYKVGITGGNKLVISRIGFYGSQIEAEKILSEVEIPNYIDGAVHKLKVRFWDNVISVYWDGNLKIEYEDNWGPLTYGSFGIYTGIAKLHLDNIYVTKYHDVLGGDYDNYFRSGFDMETGKLRLLLSATDKTILTDRWGIEIR